MPPRYSYWTILAGGLPTAFRAAEREELEPTFRRLREKHPDAEMKWFARGKLWASPEAAREARAREAAARSGPGRGGRRAGGEERGRDWRPGGSHRDPRQKFKDARKARNVEQRRAKFARKHGGGNRGGRPVPAGKPQGDTLVHRPPAGARPGGKPPRQDWRDRPPGGKPHGDARRPQGRRFQNDTRHDDRRTWSPAPPSARGEDPRQRPGPATPDARGRPDDRRHEQRGGRGDRSGQRSGATPRTDWRGRPAGEKPHGDPLANTRRERQDPRWSHTQGEAPNRGPREKPHGDPLARGRRPFDRKSFPRGQKVDEPQPPRPRGPNREPRPSESPRPTPPPRPSDPVVPPPGPPERGAPARPPGKPRG